MRHLKYLLPLLLSQLIFAQSYIWPTNAGNQLSATFAEYRPGHYHSGIDIKTYNRIGFECYAIADGYISRVLVSPHGYGKAVYLQLNDGNTAVYAHLDDFPETIKEEVRKRQKEAGRYKVNFYLQENQFPVKQGDIIAYTGCTGTRHPHLHFEVRDEKQQAVNPALLNFTVKDNTFPSIKEIALVPLSDSSEVNGLPTIQTFRVHYRGEKKYFLRASPIQVKGPVGIEIKTYDMVHGLWNKYGNYRMQMQVNGDTLFSVQCDTMNYEKYGLMSIDRDHQLKKRGDGRFIRMWAYDSTIQMPFHQEYKNAILDLPYGKHNISIDVLDFNGNRSQLDFILNSRNYITPELLNIDPDTIGYQLTIRRDTTALFKKISAKYLNFYGHFIIDAKLYNFSKDDTSYTFSVKNRSDSKYLVLNSESNHHSGQGKLLISLNDTKKTNSDEVELEFIQNPKSFLCQLNFKDIPAKQPQLFLQNRSDFVEIPLIMLTPTQYITRPIDPKIWVEAFSAEIRMENNVEIINRHEIDFHQIKPETETTLWSKDSLFSVNVPANSVYHPILIAIKKVHNGNKPVYEIYPADQNLKNKIDICYHDYKNRDFAEKYSFYAFEEDKVNHLETDYNSHEMSYSATIKGLDKFTLMCDTIPPEISNIYPGNGGSFKAASVKKLKISVVDTLSGIKDDLSLEMYLDGQKVIAEYHPILDYLRYELPEQLTAGEHHLEIIVTDNVGNITKKESRFTIL